MELYKEILVKALENKNCRVTFANLDIDAKAIASLASYKALAEIRNILSDDSLTDSDCFIKIEEIVQMFERLGSNCNNRHYF